MRTGAASGAPSQKTCAGTLGGQPRHNGFLPSGPAHWRCMRERRRVSALALLALLVAVTFSSPTLFLTPGERQTLSPDKDLPRGAEFRMPREPDSRATVFTDLGY